MSSVKITKASVTFVISSVRSYESVPTICYVIYWSSFLQNPFYTGYDHFGITHFYTWRTRLTRSQLCPGANQVFLRKTGKPPPPGHMWRTFSTAEKVSTEVCGQNFPWSDERSWIHRVTVTHIRSNFFTTQASKFSWLNNNSKLVVSHHCHYFHAFWMLSSLAHGNKSMNGKQRFLLVLYILYFLLCTIAHFNSI